MAGNAAITSFFHPKSQSPAAGAGGGGGGRVKVKKLVLIMDEIDGMSSGDAGGIAKVM